MRHTLLLLVALCAAGALPARAGATGFADFDRKAKAGERLNVVFFGSSLTWGANASDPQLTSYRALMCDRLEKAYPKANFKFWDAAMGGTNSQLGVFRLDRDVLSRKPDLVFLDFSAGDDLATDTPDTLAAYETLVRRLIAEGKAPVVQAILPFEWNATAKLDTLKRRQAHLAIAKHYNTAVGDAVLLCQERLQAGKVKVAELWPFDRVHPGDVGYELFADAVWKGFEDAVERSLTCAAPEKMLHANTYMASARVPLSKLPQLPEGWARGKPLRNSAYFDMLMSRWLDDVVVAANRKLVADGMGKPVPVPQNVGRLAVQFRGSMVMLLGESTEKSCKYRVYLDGKLIERDNGKQGKLTEFDGSWLATLLRGNTHLVQVIAEGLDPGANHTLEIEPVFSSKMVDQELRLESVCVAGGEARVLGMNGKQ
jgi:lysophospholipase L1-like esterase